MRERERVKLLNCNQISCLLLDQGVFYTKIHSDTSVWTAGPIITQNSWTVKLSGQHNV